jgi:hypothetical protein
MATRVQHTAQAVFSAGTLNASPFLAHIFGAHGTFTTLHRWKSMFVDSGALSFESLTTGNMWRKVGSGWVTVLYPNPF